MKIDLPLLGGGQHRQPRIVGIDLGTTNSLVAAMIDGEPQILASPEGHRMTPSVVAFPPGEPPIVGRAAIEWLERDPSRVVYSVKRLMGRGPSDVAEERARASYIIEEGPGEVVRVRMDDRRLTPPEISALILSELKSQAEAALGEEVAQAVITVPAYFNDSQRQATRDAGRIAGLDVLRIVNEPTAACLAYGIQRKREGLAAIYDLGGGTFDISILKLTGGVFEVLATRGDTQLGGDDFDRLLVELLLDEKRSPPGTKLAGPPPEQLRLAAEQARRLLSEEDRARVDLDQLNREITRPEFERLAAPLVERTLEACGGALADAGLSASQIEDVVLVGGATRTPLVRREVERLFGRTPHSDLNPDEVVALGAAVQAGILAGDVEDLLLLDVIPLSLGIETYGGVVEKLIPRNSTIPVAARQTFTTNVDGQSAIGIHVLQGEREMAADNRSLARFNVEIDPMPAGWPRLEVNFLVDENGILQVRAFEERSESEAVIEVRPSYGLTDDEVEDMIISSFDHAESDLRRRLLIESRVEAEQTLNATRKQMPDAREFAQAGLLPQDELRRIEEAVEALDEALGGDDYRAIRLRASSLDRVTQGLAALVVDREVSRALSGRELQSVVRETSGDTSN